MEQLSKKERQRIAKQKYRKSAKGIAAKKKDDAKYYKKNKEKIDKANRQYVIDNREKVAKYQKQYSKENKEKVKHIKKEWANNNRDKVRQSNSNWQKSNRSKCNSLLAKYRASKLKATPTWSEAEKIQVLYEKCKWLESLTGLKYEVDHVVPLQGKDVCGLHIWENLQILEVIENRTKGNRL